MSTLIHCNSSPFIQFLTQDIHPCSCLLTTVLGGPKWAVWPLLMSNIWLHRQQTFVTLQYCLENIRRVIKIALQHVSQIHQLNNMNVDSIQHNGSMSWLPKLLQLFMSLFLKPYIILKVIQTKPILVILENVSIFLSYFYLRPMKREAKHNLLYPERQENGGGQSWMYKSL